MSVTTQTIHELPTPCALVDLDRVEANTARMAARAHALGVKLRPHVKTHKCAEAARLQIRDHFGGITVSTLAEARGFIAAGFDDLLWAVPPSLGRIPELVTLNASARLDTLCDHPDTLAALAEEAARQRRVVGVWLEIDCGDGRGGLYPDSEALLALGAAAQGDPWIALRGLLTHGGQSYGCVGVEAIQAVAEAERAQIVEAAARLRAAGVQIDEISLGSTPTLSHGLDLTGVTEVRPGNYVFFDAFQAAIGSCELADAAFTVLATVIGRYPEKGTLIIDAGALSLTKDPGPRHAEADPGYGRLARLGPGGALIFEPALRLEALSQEHGVIRVEGPWPSEDRWPVGSRLRVVPNHSCLSAACFSEYQVIQGEAVIAQWRPHRGW